ncbi:MAG: NAD(P)/FAD-dependent oxidoreductase [Halomonadaceae bacterium]|nr:MAG: NAD(P)/FAD-dependent oxidoreductase [Halomonadaceae bacterium]
MATRIVIVGGGAGGLELATALASQRRWRKRHGIDIVLVDRNSTHLWKPLLHEVASGAMDSSVDELSYRALARQRGFRFKIGEFCHLDPANKRITLGAVEDDEHRQVLPERQISYDYLVMALGSVTNDFSTPGIVEHCHFLDNSNQAERFQYHFLNSLMRTDNELGRLLDSQVSVAVVGGGATGVELSAELMAAVEAVREYGFSHLTSKALQVTLLEAGPRLLPMLPERLSENARLELERLGVTVRLSAPVVRAEHGALITQEGEQLNSDLMVWAAGIKGPDCLTNQGLTLTRNGQMQVHNTLQSVDHPAIFALGDCAACPRGDELVPPRAQSAHQMAGHLVKNLHRATQGQALTPFHYLDRGSLITLSHYSAVGSLMGGLSKGSLWVEGRIARLMYLSLYRMHQIAVYGLWRGILIVFTDRLHRAFRPRLKLH